MYVWQTSTSDKKKIIKSNHANFIEEKLLKTSTCDSEQDIIIKFILVKLKYIYPLLMKVWYQSRLSFFLSSFQKYFQASKTS